MPTQETIVKYTGLLDDYLSDNLVSGALDNSTNSKVIDYFGAGSVKVPKITVPALGAYTRGTGYAKGAMTVEYETRTLTQDRSAQWQFDREDDEETALVRSVSGAKKFMRTSVVPQVDAYRFSVYATGAGTKAAAALTADTITTAIEAAEETLGESGASEGAKLFISYKAYGLLKQAIKRQLANDAVVSNGVTSYDEMQIIPVRSVSFTQNPTFSTDGYAPGANGINFLVVNPESIAQFKKHESMKVFSPDVNQTGDDWLFDYRLYHDAWVLPELEDGIYVHTTVAIA